LHWIMSIAIDVLIMVSQLIAIIDPMGALPLIMSMPNIEQTSVFRRALKIIAIAVPTLLIFFAVAGPYILTAFNISIADFRIAGGIVLLVIGIDTLREGAPRTMGLSPEDYVFVPIVTPMLAAFIFRAGYQPYASTTLGNTLIVSGFTCLCIRFLFAL